MDKTNLDVVRQHILRNLAMYKGGPERKARHGFFYLNDAVKGLKLRHSISDQEWQNYHNDLTYYRSKFNDQRIKLNNLGLRIKVFKGTEKFDALNSKIRKLGNEAKKQELRFLAQTVDECKALAEPLLDGLVKAVKALEKELPDV